MSTSMVDSILNFLMVVSKILRMCVWVMSSGGVGGMGVSRIGGGGGAGGGGGGGACGVGNMAHCKGACTVEKLLMMS